MSSPEQEIKWHLGTTPAFIGEAAFRIYRVLFYSVPSNLKVSPGFTLMPGPIVVVRVIRLMYSPFAPEGRSLCTASINAAKFS